MTPTVHIVDYGIGNLASLARAIEAVGARPVAARTAEALAGAESLVLPGVGAFADCMRALEAHGLADAVRAHAAANKPFLGICVGMQMLFETGEEFGEFPGLGLVGGRVRALPRVSTAGEPLRVPHIGWTAIAPPAGAAGWTDGPLAPLAPGACVYFLHSFAAVPADPSDILAECRFGGHRVTAAIRRGNLFGCQFHPEKSGAVGLRILEAFAALRPTAETR